MTYNNLEPQRAAHNFRTLNPNSTPKWVWLIFALGLVAVLLLAGMLWWSHRQVTQLRDDLSTQQSASKAQEENRALLDKIGAIILLPKDETPTIATVNDLDKLKGQPFFANAQLGDKVLIYAKAKKAVLYRPSENKVIELAPLSDNGAVPTNTP
jgi:hypothetical protein